VERNVKYVHTAFGEIAYTDRGQGQPALFVHGVFMNGYLWRHVVDRVADLRRTIAVDLMAHGATKTPGDQDVSFAAQAEMLEALCENLKLSHVDLVGNDSGGGIAQIFAARHPERIRSLTLTNCDTYDNWPAEPFQRVINAAAAGQGQVAAGIRQMLSDVSIARGKFSRTYEHPELVSEETFRIYLEPLVRTPESIRNFERFLTSADNRQTMAVEPLLKRLNAPTLIVWAMDDVTFEVKWAYWLRDTIPGTRKVIQLDGARLFFPEERPDALAAALREHWRDAPRSGHGRS
jgi:pimeloyl-ACP methyl ester carboxylesterase